jgi:hypothetical protein
MHLPGKRHGLAAFGAIVAMLLAVSSVLAVTDIPVAPAAPYSQTFGSDPSATVTLPGDFRVDKLTGARVLGTYAAALTATERQGGESLSSTAANGIYNFGAGPAATATDRAIGFLSSGSATQSGNLYGQFTNNTGQALTGLTLSYDVEKYRNGSNAAGFRIQLFHSANGSAWTDAGSSFLTTFGSNADNSG